MPKAKDPTLSWPRLGKDGRAWVRSDPEPEDKWARAYPHRFVCGKTKSQHPQDKGGIQHYCWIPEDDPSKFCDEKALRSRWARMHNRFYKGLADDMAVQKRQLERRANR